VRSVYTTADGTPLSQVPGFANGHNSSLKERWGGWYVTGTHQGVQHLGNLFATNSLHPDQLDLSAGSNITELGERFERRRYLSPHSDIVALMVLEHEVRMHNLITRANYETRYALKELNSNPAWSQQRIQRAGEMLLEYMLFRNEAPLKGAVAGTSSFAKDFESNGPCDAKGRSLRKLDLRSRLFRYPCSFLVYSAGFDGLPQEMKSYLWRRLEEILAGKDKSATYASMPASDRQAVWEILRDTKPEFAAWLATGNNSVAAAQAR
jgi:hypothetical protein